MVYSADFCGIFLLALLHLVLIMTNGSSSTTADSEFTLRASSPLFLHSSDKLGMSLVVVPFSSCGFGGWRRSINALLYPCRLGIKLLSLIVVFPSRLLVSLSLNSGTGVTTWLYPG